VAPIATDDYDPSSLLDRLHEMANSDPNHVENMIKYGTAAKKGALMAGAAAKKNGSKILD
jgi:hypothetical protein